METKKSIFVIIEFGGGGSLNTHRVHCAGRGISEALACRIL
jgi:5'-AMP-activated protein kinase catalytic alpha subunit